MAKKKPIIHHDTPLVLHTMINKIRDTYKLALICTEQKSSLKIQCITQRCYTINVLTYVYCENKSQSKSILIR
jgi:hypothetical protein